MVDDPNGQQQMVLVDKRHGRVYSTAQPVLPDGSRPQIGVWNNGHIELFERSTTDNATDESQTHLGKYALLPLGTVTSPRAALQLDNNCGA
jgi:hypothetical protein